MFSHLTKVKMSYFQHLNHSLHFSRILFSGSIKAFIHGILPTMYETSTTDLTRELNIKLFDHNMPENDE